MNIGAIGERLLFAAAIIAFVLLFSLMRRGNPRKRQAEIVRTLLLEAGVNMILVDTFDRQPKPRNFETTGWQLHKKKLDFLEKELQKDINNSFGMGLDYNQRLKAAKKAKSTKKESLDLETMKVCLIRVKDGLEDWLLVNIGTIEPERPGMFDGLFGR